MAVHDHLPDDPAIVDRPSRSAARKPKRRGFFGGKIPWVVYALTIIQVAVFIGELARSGMSKSKFIRLCANFARQTHWFTY